VTAPAALQAGSLISYAIAVIVPALDAVLPVLPSETAVITLGVATAGSADPRIALLLACWAAGAFVGDNLCYLLGRRFGPHIEGRFFRGGKGAQRRAWAERSLQRYGMPLRLDRVVIAAVNTIRRSFRVHRATQRELGGERIREVPGRARPDRSRLVSTRSPPPAHG